MSIVTKTKFYSNSKPDKVQFSKSNLDLDLTLSIPYIFNGKYPTITIFDSNSVRYVESNITVLLSNSFVKVTFLEEIQETWSYQLSYN